MKRDVIVPWRESHPTWIIHPHEVCACLRACVWYFVCVRMNNETPSLPIYPYFCHLRRLEPLSPNLETTTDLRQPQGRNRIRHSLSESVVRLREQVGALYDTIMSECLKLRGEWGDWAFDLALSARARWKAGSFTRFFSYSFYAFLFICGWIMRFS